MNNDNKLEELQNDLKEATRIQGIVEEDSYEYNEAGALILHIKQKITEIYENKLGELTSKYRYSIL